MKSIEEITDPKQVLNPMGEIPLVKKKSDPVQSFLFLGL